MYGKGEAAWYCLPLIFYFPLAILCALIYNVIYKWSETLKLYC